MKKGIGHEDRMHKSFASLIRGYHTLGKLNCAFWSYDSSGENRNIKTGALLKAKGLNTGQSDYFFKTIRDNTAHYIHLEFKTAKGKQSLNQKRFEETCTANNEKYYLARSVNEAINILEKENILLK